MMFRFTVRANGRDRRVPRLGSVVRSALHSHATVDLDVHHAQYGWWGRITITPIPSAVLPQTYAVRFESRPSLGIGEGVIEEPLTDERIAFAIGYAVGSARPR